IWEWCNDNAFTPYIAVQVLGAIADLLAENGFKIDKKKIVLDEPIKALGVYEVPVKLHPEVTGVVKVWVVRE
ncbi:MAG TPA: 50S ribosomal L9 C-terminal domain-containing protein, partial [bacterium]|nr:50S ribosomal L9 C-terminal domain-containing protein [bacterium]